MELLAILKFRRNHQGVSGLCQVRDCLLVLIAVTEPENPDQSAEQSLQEPVCPRLPPMNWFPVLELLLEKSKCLYMFAVVEPW